MTAPRWDAAGLTAHPTTARHPHLGVVIRTRGTTLGPEHARSLAWWLLGYVGDRSGPADPDKVRLAIDEARASLASKSAMADTSEDFRAGLAWVQYSLDRIAEAAR